MQSCHKVFNLFMCTERPVHTADSLMFLHCCIHLAESLCAPPRSPKSLFSVFFADDALLWQVSHKFLSLRPVLSVSPRSSLFVSLLLWCHSSLTLLSPLCADLPPRAPRPPPCPSVPLSPLVPLPRLMFFRCDRSRVNFCIFFFFFLLASLSAVVLSPADVFPSEWRRKWKSCTSRHSRGRTACTCEHKTSGDAVTSCLLSYPLLIFLK